MNEGDTSRLAQAAARRVRLTENELEGCPELSEWLTEDPRNAVAWKQVQDDWALFGEYATSPEILELRSAALAHAHEAGRRRWVRSRRFAIAHRLGIAAGILILVAGGMLVLIKTTKRLFHAHWRATDRHFGGRISGRARLR